MRAINSREFTGLDEEVVGAHLEAHDPIHFVGAPRQHDDRYIRRRAQMSGTGCMPSSSPDGTSSTTRSMRVRSSARSMPAPLLARGDAQPMLFEVRRERGARLRVFVDDEHVFACA